MENSIKEDIKILEEFKTNGYNILLMKYGDRIKTNFKLEKAIEHILSDYKRVLKENEQLRTEVNSLKKENEELNEKILDNAGIYQLGFKDGEESYIKKVKDKIRKNEEIIDISNDGDLIHELYQKNKVYEELLESEK